MENNEFIFESYLTEKSLELFLNQEFDIEYNDVTYIIEFDGHQHFNDINVIKRDFIKDDIIGSLNYKLIRIPYFVQLTNQTFEYYFGFINNINIIQNFPHGFIDKKALLPASYCEKGIQKFKYIIDFLPENIKKDILNSLRNYFISEDASWIIPQQLYRYF